MPRIRYQIRPLGTGKDVGFEWYKNGKYKHYFIHSHNGEFINSGVKRAFGLIPVHETFNKFYFDDILRYLNFLYDIKGIFPLATIETDTYLTSEIKNYLIKLFVFDDFGARTKSGNYGHDYLASSLEACMEFGIEHRKEEIELRKKEKHQQIISAPWSY